MVAYDVATFANFLVECVRREIGTVDAGVVFAAGEWSARVFADGGLAARRVAEGDSVTRLARLGDGRKFGASGVGGGYVVSWVDGADGVRLDHVATGVGIAVGVEEEKRGSLEGSEPVRFGGDAEIDQDVDRVGSRGTDDDGGVAGVESARGCGGIGSVGVTASLLDGCVAGRGPNYERNRRNRELQRDRKKKRQAMGCDWRSGARCALESKKVAVRDVFFDSRCVESGPVVGSDGFWKSCSSGVRQELIDSKARMHIAENQRREREAKEKLAAMDSPAAMVAKVLDLVKMTEVAAKRANDSKVAGWAKTVAESHSEELARSAPSTMKSFESFVSDSSVPIEIHDELLGKYHAEQEKAEMLRKENEDLRKKTSEQCFAVQAQKEIDLDGCSGLRRDLMNEERKLVAKYETMLGYDPVVLQMEKAMLKKKAKYAPLFRVSRS